MTINKQILGKWGGWIGMAILILILFAENSCHKKQLATLATAYNRDTVGLKRRVLDAEAALYTMEQKYGTEKDALALLSDKYVAVSKELKNIKAVVSVKVGAKVDNVEAKYITDTIHDTLKVKDTLYIPVGTKFAKLDKWYYIAGELGSEAVKFDSIGFKAGDIRVIIANQKKNIFSRKHPVVDLIVENPHFTVNSANNVIVQDKRKPKRGLWLVTGLVAGLTIGLLAH